MSRIGALAFILYQPFFSAMAKHLDEAAPKDYVHNLPGLPSIAGLRTGTES